jgi:hypothetical protein
MLDDSFLYLIALPLVGGAALSYAVEAMLRTKCAACWKRPPAALLIHLGLWIVLFSLELILFRRPCVAAANVLALLLFVVLVSNAKYISLREPFVVQDFDFFIDTFKYPRLYLPFLGMWRAAAAGVAIAGALYAGLELEKPLTGLISTSAFLAGTAALCLLGCCLVWIGSRLQPELSFEPKEDLRRLGLLPSLWCYGAEERKPVSQAGERAFVAPAVPVSGHLPNLVVVQSESFLDVRRLYPEIRPEMLRHFDQIKETAIRHGLLQVPAWGANTVRTEFSFLSGLGNESLGIHRFNPYRYLPHHGIPTLVGFLKRFGYRTICVHPYPAGFYSRDKVFPSLGFDEFIDIRSLEDVPKSGQYTGDVGLARKVADLLETSSRNRRPVFLFVITMENHGPLHCESVAPGEDDLYYHAPPPSGCDDLTVYLRHMLNADRMIGILRRSLESLEGDGWLCFFGDHPPIMSGVYKALGTPDNHTDYFIWNKEHQHKTPFAADMKVEDLGVLLVREMGLSRRHSRKEPFTQISTETLRQRLTPSLHKKKQIRKLYGSAGPKGV